MLRLIRLYTGDDGQSHIEKSEIPYTISNERNQHSPWFPVTNVCFAESPPGSSLDWHTAPQRQYVITLTGSLEFTTRNKDRFILNPGDILLAEDTTGGGHKWRLVNDQPWRRIYIQLPED